MVELEFNNETWVKLLSIADQEVVGEYREYIFKRLDALDAKYPWYTTEKMVELFDIYCELILHQFGVTVTRYNPDPIIEDYTYVISFVTEEDAMQFKLTYM